MNLRTLIRVFNGPSVCVAKVPTFLPVDKPTLRIKSLNYSFENGDMTVMQKQGLISLLPKKNNDLGNLNNWRPLTLLNTDYRIVTKTISNRIKNTYLIS